MVTPMNKKSKYLKSVHLQSFIFSSKQMTNLSSHLILLDLEVKTGHLKNRDVTPVTSTYFYKITLERL